MHKVRCVTIGGVGAALTIEDVLHVATGRRVEVETGALDKLGKYVSKEIPKETISAQPMQQESMKRALSERETKAGLFVRLVTLIRGKSGVRPEMISCLTERLNAELFDLKIAAEMQDRNLLTSVAAASGMEMWETEREVFCSGSCFSAGIGALNVHCGSLLLTVANAVASISCEALGASTKTFDPQRLESLANKNGQEVGEVMRTLLTGSKRINSKKLGVGNVKGISDIPMTHGAALDATAALQLSLRSELNAQALDFKALEEFPYEVPMTLSAHLDALTKSVMRVTASSSRRIEHLLGRLPDLKLLQELPDVTPIPKERLEEIKSCLEEKRGVLDDQFVEVKQMLQEMQLTEDVCPSAGVAIVGHATLQILSEMLSLECTLGLVSLQILEGPTADNAELPTASAKSKKDRKGKAGGMILGQGTAALRRFFQNQPSQENENAETPSWPSFLLSNEILESMLTNCKEMLTMDGARLQDVAQVVHQQVEVHQARRKPKIPKGARDFLPDQMRIRQTVFDKITAVFKRHGAVSIDTPVFELKETLTGKYGEDSKLIYDLADQGGEILSLRYDLTVPFARYVALNSVGNIKRYHIGKVYRRDQPQMTKGRFREFFQCDFDIAGTYSVMVPDAECVKVLVEILGELQLGEFEVKVNHRRLIDAMMDICGVPANKHRTICSAIDKLDKEPWDVVKAEMVTEKGLDPSVADRLGVFVQIRDAPQAFLQTLTTPEHPFMQNTDATEALKELEILVGYLEKMQALDSIVFDLSLARGLDYYSGLIYEAVFKDSGTGSVAAGGRYDKLVGMFSGKDVPAVGVSIGVERVFAIMEKQMKEAASRDGITIRTNDTQVLVASIGNGLQQRRMEICSRLWSAGIAAEFGYKPNPKMADNLNYALQEGIPFMVLFGEDELKEQKLKLKDLKARTEDSLPESHLIPELVSRLGVD